MASKVYWADLRADFRENLQQKLTRLMKTAGMGEIDFDKKYVAIKMHFGEPVTWPSFGLTGRKPWRIS